MSRVGGIDDHLRPYYHAERLEHGFDHLRRDVGLHVPHVDFGLRQRRGPAKRNVSEAKKKNKRHVSETKVLGHYLEQLQRDVPTLEPSAANEYPGM